MTKERLLVRVLGSCETMANASVVCTDKTGTLTQNEMTVVAGSVGVHAKFVRGLAENAARTNADDVARKHAQDFSVEQARLNDVLSPALQTLLNDSVAVNSTAFEDTDPDTGVRAFVGSKTETALLKLAQELQWADWRATRAAANVLQMIPFASARKAMGVVVRRGKGARLYLKGASEILAVRCTTHVVVRPPGADGPPVGDAVETAPLGELEADNVNRTIIFYANQTLRTIALCYRDFDVWPPPNVHFTDETMAEVGRVRRSVWRRS
jgi:Ca2+-transporting ATPase